MSFLVDEHTRVLVQGVTGVLGRFVVSMMIDHGLTPVAGVTPGKGGTLVSGVPVFDSVDAAVASEAVNASLVMVPAVGLRDAVLEAIESGISPIVLMVDGVPLGLSEELLRAARMHGVTIIGPNSPGLITPGKCLLGALHPAKFTAGDIAVISRSGGMMSTIAYTLASAGLGTSTCLGIGGDSVIGLDMPAAALLAEQDPDSRAIVIFGEIGTTQEERLGALVRTGAITKPVIVYIAGTAAPAGIRYSHAGAKTDGESGTALWKKKRLAEDGVIVVDRYVDIPAALASASPKGA
jgi:succinyl-CoA synthetase alpha subunit